MAALDNAQARFWDRFARRYAALKIRDPEGYQKSLDRALHYIRGAPNVLEIGCGTGTIALKLAPAVGHILATDISPNMVAIARQKAEAQQISNVEFIVASSSNLPVLPNSVDAVLAFAILHLLPDRADVLARLRSVLNPGGVLVTKTPCLAELRLRYRLLIPVLRLIGLAPRFAMFTAETLAADIAAAGFEIVETGRHGSGERDVRFFLVAKRP